MPLTKDQEFELVRESCQEQGIGHVTQKLWRYISGTYYATLVAVAEKHKLRDAPEDFVQEFLANIYIKKELCKWRGGGKSLGNYLIYTLLPFDIIDQIRRDETQKHIFEGEGESLYTKSIENVDTTEDRAELHKSEFKDDNHPIIAGIDSTEILKHINLSLSDLYDGKTGNNTHALFLRMWWDNESKETIAESLQIKLTGFEKKKERAFEALMIKFKRRLKKYCGITLNDEKEKSLINALKGLR